MNRPLKNKTRPSSTPSALAKPGAPRSGGGPDNYDGRANTNAGTPEPKQYPGSVVVLED